MLKKLFRYHKNIKVFYYAGCIWREIYPHSLCRKILEKKLKSLSQYDLEYMKYRLGYYNKLTENSSLGSNAIPLTELKLPKRKRVYYFDTIEFTRFFANHLKASFLFGDITHIPDEPSITKSRPINGDNRNSVILKLEKSRHFMFVKYDKPFIEKKNMLIWRGVTGSKTQNRKHRIMFMEMYFNNPVCNLGKINDGGGPDEWRRGKLTIDQHLEYKFILSLEGNDVASNLKWVMSSNSIAVMPKPKYETWFMEGTLQPDYHYIEIKDDYSDLEDKISYYINNTDKALQIIKNAHDYVNQFRIKKREDILSLLVLERYFVKTGQLKPISTAAI
ncbi:MAG: lipopolysaccharide A protein [Cyclobacteriaceae bacterium]|nr:lipopolysaccharide A protein [Cyclobacteriaceae bacterium]